jgi:CHRD domain-containing protein/PEP-CTERM motif-containing protein
MKAALTYVFASCLFFTLHIAPAAPIVIGTATLTGADEVPPTGSGATGFVTVLLDGNLLDVDLTFSGLEGGPAAAAHIHCCTPQGTNTGVAVGFPGFPAATSGTYMHEFDLTDAAVYTAAFLNAHGGTAGGAEAALLTGIEDGLAYVNIHDAEFQGGEIRGFLTPEPSSVTLLALGLVAVAVLSRRFAVR